MRKIASRFVLPLLVLTSVIAVVALRATETSHRPKALHVAYLERGREVKKSFRIYNASLAGYYHELLTALDSNAPKLADLLRAPNPVISGYQILPQLLPNGATETAVRDRSVGYSWPWTERLIERERRRLHRLETELQRVAQLDPVRKQIVLQKLALEYQSLYEKLRNIEAHIEYNSFWQAVIAADRTRYDHDTSIYNEVIERNQIRDRLRYWRRVSATVPAGLRAGFGLLSLMDLTDSLQQREALLSERIESEIRRVQPPIFLQIENRPQEWLFRVPIYTDIEDQDFIAAVKRIIEEAWRVTEKRITYRLVVDIFSLPAALLYPGAEKPVAGQKIDILQHLNQFPQNAAILTTGGLTTYVRGNAIILGPHPIGRGVLAHEFGHILGFRDRYIRGYRDLGTNGFEIMETFDDPSDIMAQPATGSVLASHFKVLLNATRAQHTPA